MGHMIKYLIDIIPRLHHHRIELLHQILVIKSADSSGDGSQHDEVNPFVMFKVNAFLLTGTAQHKERKYGKHDSDPLIQVQTFTEYQHGTHQHHYRTGSINRADNRQRQIASYQSNRISRKIER